MTSNPFPTLTTEELDALEKLDKSIKIHEDDAKQGEESDEDRSVNLTDDEENTITVNVPHSFHPFKLPAIPESREAEPDTNRSQRKMNTGYIIYDGSEIKYVSSKPGHIDSLRGTSTLSSEKGSSIRSRASTATHTSDIPVNFYLSAEELLDCDYLNRNRRFSVTHYNRLPTNSHFSITEKLYFFLLGLACVISFSAIFVSVSFFKPFFGDHVLSTIGRFIYLDSSIFYLSIVWSFLAFKTNTTPVASPCESNQWEQAYEPEGFCPDSCVQNDSFQRLNLFFYQCFLLGFSSLYLKSNIKYF